MYNSLTSNFTKIGIFFIVYWAITKADILEKIKFYHDDLSSKYYPFSNFLHNDNDKSKGCKYN